jgi:hypothetical protein
MINLDGHILTKALVYAIVTIDALPPGPRHKAKNERGEMVNLLNQMVLDPAERERLAVEVENITGKLADLTDWRLGNAD